MIRTLHKIYNVAERLILMIIVLVDSLKVDQINKDKLLKLTHNYNPNSGLVVDRRGIRIFSKKIEIQDFDTIWHMDPLSNFQFLRNMVYFRRPRLKCSSDIKCTWELARLNFILPWLLRIQASGNEALVIKVKK